MACDSEGNVCKYGTNLNRKVIMSLIPSFYVSLFDDLRLIFPEYQNCSLDRDYVLKRLVSEGDKFALQVLPTIGKALEISLITLTQFPSIEGFALKSGRCYPKFLSFFFEALYSDEGLPLWRYHHDCSGVREAASRLWALRQILLAFSKVKSATCLENDCDTIQSFKERVTTPVTLNLSGHQIARIRKLIRNLLTPNNELHAYLAQWDSNPFGRHGPGAVARKEKGALKWNFSRISGTDPLLYKWHSSSFQKNDSTSSANRVVLVPKDFRKKRTICIEPKEFQFAQQGLMDILYSIVEDDFLVGRCIHFHDQVYNQTLAKRADCCTIDLKDASDRVSLILCRLLLPKVFLKLVTRYRSRSTILPDGEEIRPTCFASMGSALCFPVESIVFWAIAQAALDDARIRGPVRVFGDDIICPIEGYDIVTDWLIAAGLVVNESKSCHKGPVRESCGAWYFGNYDCKIIRFSNLESADVKSWHGILEDAKQLQHANLSNASNAILEHLDTYSKWKIPFGYLGLPRPKPCDTSIRRWNKSLQRYEIKVPTNCVAGRKTTVFDDQVLYAWLVGNDTHPSPLGTPKGIKMEWVDAAS